MGASRWRERPGPEGRSLTKTFPGVKALTDVSIQCNAHQVLALVGENGAGKSTLVNLLSGVYQPDGGEILLKGTPTRVRDPHHAASLGIATVHQELSLLPHLTVAENILLGSEPTARSGFLRTREIYRRAGEALADISPAIHLDAMVYALSPAERQMVEIAKAWSHRPRLLILDEPTSSLSKVEAGSLLALVDRLRSQGTSVVFISHRLDEVFEISDEVMVMKDGRRVDTLPIDHLDRSRLIQLMVGREMTQTFPPRRREPAGGQPLLELRDAAPAGSACSVNLKLHWGEIVGLGGLEGQGQRELIRGIFGIEPFATGQVLMDGKPVRIASPAAAIDAGLAFIPDDRKAEGLVLPLTIRENMVLASLAKVLRLGFVQAKQEQAMVGEYMGKLAVKAPTADQIVGNLSGGNQQKVILAKWLLTQPKLLVLHEPTRGIDIQTKVEIYRLLRRLADQGVGVLIATGDMLELIGLSDRIYVMYEGAVAGEVRGEEASEERLMALSSGGGVA
ncbi:MAG: sugar ABC transporter ATP-binding protein [Firmicutes bacterium]|nr:sugar ABC transporter ATP-binding protein [Bacillota bacterium]